LLGEGCQSFQSWLKHYLPGDGSPGVPVVWGAFGCLWLGSPLYLSKSRGAGLWLHTLAIG
ncbi:hypothetical protein ATANTOWER_019883, partial [Ataeniobius toweri]|nr:hypothetical protein [Ataeniobius toweri]